MHIGCFIAIRVTGKAEFGRVRGFFAKFFWGLAAVGILISPVLAQNIPATEDGARISEQFAEPTAPLSVEPAPVLQLESTNPPASAATTTVNVREIALIDSTIYSATDVAALAPKGQQPLSAVYAFAQQLTAQYSEDEILLSRVIVPPQALDPNDAHIRLQAVEGWIDEVVWPEEVDGYRDFFRAFASKITGQRPLNIKTLERYLLLASDLPGLTFGSTLEPSRTTAGASRLLVTVERSPVDAMATTDNFGSEGRGPYQLSGTLTLNNAFRQHERLSATVAGSFETEELLYGQLGFEQVLNAEGLTASLTLTADRGAPGTPQLRTLLFESRSLTWVGGLRYPLIRTRTENLSLFASIFANDYQSDALGSRFSNDRLRGARVGFRYDRFDQWNGITQLAATLSQGINGLGSTDNNSLLASRANGRVDFTKFEGSVSRTQRLEHGFSLLAHLHGQYAATPLLASEECGFGGADVWTRVHRVSSCGRSLPERPRRASVWPAGVAGDDFASSTFWFCRLRQSLAPCASRWNKFHAGRCQRRFRCPAGLGEPFER
ncbi:MAG: ShlB/FhaC/HecB family hemolysin secretion/activation protein [Hyphomicrobiales bacterium]